MKFYLVLNQDCRAEADYNSYKNLAVNAKIVGEVMEPFRGAWGGVGGAAAAADDASAQFARFKAAFERDFGEGTWVLRVDMRSVCGPLRVSQKWNILLQGPILKAVHEMVNAHFGDDRRPLQIKMAAKCHRHDRITGRADLVATVKAEEMTPTATGNGTIHPNCYEERNVEMFPSPPLPCNRIHGGTFVDNWTVTVEVTVPHFQCHVPRDAVAATNRKIFTERKYCDFEIVSGEGVVIPCHKAFLAAQSPVFEQMLDGAVFEEAQTNRMRIKDMSTAGVNAFLEFLYCKTLGGAYNSPEITLELLMAADKYDVQEMWNAAMAILLSRDHTWFDVDVALKTFEFMNNRGGDKSVEVMTKMMQVLHMKSGELSRSTRYHEVFQSPLSKAIFGFCLENTNLN